MLTRVASASSIWRTRKTWCMPRMSFLLLEVRDGIRARMLISHGKWHMLSLISQDVVSAMLVLGLFWIISMIWVLILIGLWARILMRRICLSGWFQTRRWVLLMLRLACVTIMRVHLFLLLMALISGVVSGRCLTGQLHWCLRWMESSASTNDRSAPSRVVLFLLARCVHGCLERLAVFFGLVMMMPIW